jgi:tetratricopeptide (TPR) repeat protein
MRFVLSSLVVICGLTLMSAAQERAVVSVWRGSVQIPTYSEGPANPNPPFDVFSFGRFNYPYPIRDSLTDAREVVSWRSLHLENEYLRVTVLPDLGGHLYSCLDKRTGREMFYANSTIKKALIGYRGAWAALGIEFNFPVSHNWMSMSPVDFATASNPDGSGTIWVGNVDQVYGSHWRVQLRLEPGRPVLRQQVDLYNASDVRHRYYWWNNAAVQVWDDSQLVYPTELMATHGFTRIEPWPIDMKGRDLSIIRHQTDGPVSLFTYGTREGFVGVYHPHTNSGTVHVASPAQLPTHKVWSWGYDRDAADWRTALSDDDSAYVELQSGLFRNQETYAFLEPQESVRFAEAWLPVRDLGGITRANNDAILSMSRSPQASSEVRLALDVTLDLADARLKVGYGAKSLIDRQVSLSPREVWRAQVDAPPGVGLTFELSDAAGRIVLHHEEDVFDRMSADEVKLGPPAAARTPARGDDVASALERGQIDELEGRRLTALARYRAALVHHPESFLLLKAAGRLGVVLGWTNTASDGAAAIPLQWLASAHARDTTDAEVEYYFGLALVDAGRLREATQYFESAQRFRATRVPATLQLARLLAATGDAAGGLWQVQQAVKGSDREPVLGAIEVALLRRLGRKPAARDRAKYWAAIDPTSSMLRYERTQLGEPDPDLWTHLAADANRVLDIVDQYLAIGGYTEALALLEHDYPRLDFPMREPGAIAPNESPLVAYYRAFVRARLGGDPAADYNAARRLGTTYVFPNRRSSYAVLKAAVTAHPDDETARFLLGSLYLASGQVTAAVQMWETVRAVRPAIPTLHRSLGLALLQQSHDYNRARAVLEEGTTADPANVEVYLALDGVLSAAKATAPERVSALRRFPSTEKMPASVVFKLALALAEAGEAQPAERLFHDRFFPREEGGTSVRTVYTQTRLTSARRAADRSDCRGALSLIDGLNREQPTLAFTSGGLADALAPPFMSEQVSEIEARCGRSQAARARWERLAGALARDGAPLTLAIAGRAERRLGRALSAADRERLERAVEAAESTLEAGGTSNPGLIEYSRASLLALLGRRTDASEAYRRVFIYPDRGLSHALARMALQDQSPQPKAVR